MSPASSCLSVVLCCGASLTCQWSGWPVSHPPTPPLSSCHPHPPHPPLLTHRPLTPHSPQVRCITPTHWPLLRTAVPLLTPHFCCRFGLASAGRPGRGGGDWAQPTRSSHPSSENTRIWFQAHKDWQQFLTQWKGGGGVSAHNLFKYHELDWGVMKP